MWSPEDKSALPTPEELKKAIEAIYKVQGDLEIAIRSLPHARFQVEMLKRELEERKAWIAPVRRLPSDVLLEVFEWCGDIEWRSPVRIAGVCRMWRRVVLATPRAWSFVDLASEMTSKGIKMFFERSCERRLHIFLPESRSIDLLSSVVHRIRCLSFKTIPSCTRNLKFSSLERLTISPLQRTAPLSYISIHQFPALCQLVTTETCLEKMDSFTDIDTLFPQLECWSLRIGQDPGWFDGLRSCQNTLVSLSLYLPAYETLRGTFHILLPRLKCLEIIAGNPWERWQLGLRTPRLETYIEYASADDSLKSPIHADVGMVVQLLLNSRRSLSYFRQLQKLQVSNLSQDVIHSVLDQLSIDGGLCPTLRIIEFLGGDFQINPPHVEKLLIINAHRSQPICMTVLNEWTDLPGVIPDSCGDNMPCYGCC